MEFFDNINWYYTKRMLMCVGLWPFQQSLIQKIFSSIVFIIVISIFIPEVFKVITVWGDISMVAECAQSLALHSVSLIKLLSCSINIQKLRNLLRQIQKDWQLEFSDSEKQILNDYLYNARKFVHAYAFLIYSITLVYMSSPLAPKVLDYFVPLNDSRETILLYPVEYFVDLQKYQIPIFIHAYVITPFPSIIVVAVDTAYFNFVQHGCSMFTVIGHRLQTITDKVNAEIQEDDACNRSIHEMLKNCVEIHNTLLQYCETLESAFTACLLPIVMINAVTLSITGFDTMIKMNEPTEALRFGAYTTGLVFHLYCFSYPGQNLIDHSESLQTLVYDGKWYRLPPKIRRFYVLTMIRSHKPCTITAGKIYIMSIESFGKVIKLAISYFTLLISLQ